LVPFDILGREAATRLPHPSHSFRQPLPYGAVVRDHGVQFVVFSRSATAMRVLLYEEVQDTEPFQVVDFHPQDDRWGDVWSVFVPNLTAGQLYHFQADGPWDPSRGMLFNPKARLIDPFAEALAGDFQPADDGIVRPPKCVVIDDAYCWSKDRHLRCPLSETVIYEMHVRGFTQSETSGVEHPGTYLGVIEKIPYLKSLGITAVELMPVHEFPTNGSDGRPEERPNYWGYDPLAFFAPHRGYASDPTPGSQVREFKQMVEALHEAGIEVILDVVLNHTAEGNEQGPILSLKGLENNVFYMLDEQGRFRNFSGCGNTINGNHPIVREMLFLCLRHWVLNYRIDGFRFDLASILSRDRYGNLMPNTPVVEAIAEDPLLADTKLIAEAWDAAGAYQVGSFHALRWAEWNGRYRDDVRRYWRGDGHMVSQLATRLSGSSDLYQASGRHPYHSINFVTAHDGFTLNDLVSYEHKHNEPNGEDGRDGENNNNSINYGVEGPTRRRKIDRLRLRHIKNVLTTLMLSQGVPMLLMGDECRRTQQGNNNAYCQDNEISWFDWELVRRHDGLVRFVRELIHFRRREPTVRRTRFLSGQPDAPGAPPDVSWYSADGEPFNWSHDDGSLMCVLGAFNELPQRGHHLLLLIHATMESREFIVPEHLRGLGWRQLIDTAAEPPHDIYPRGDGPPLSSAGRYTATGRSIVCFMANSAETNGAG